MIRTIEQIVMSFAIRYQRLSEMVEYEFSKSKYSNSSILNIFIDLTKIYASINNEPIDGMGSCNENPASAPAAILNLCAHYKSFFRRGYSTEVKIYLIDSSKIYPINKSHIIDYHYKSHKYNDNIYVANSREVLKTICPYLDNIYYAETQHEFGVSVYDILNITNPNLEIPSIVLTRDMYNWQLANHDSICIFNVKKYNGDDLSYVINHKILIYSYISARKIKIENDIKLNQIMNLDSKLFPLLLSMSRVPERNIKSINSIPSALNGIIRAINDSNIINGTNNFIEPVIYKFCSSGYTKVDPFVLSTRLNAIDLTLQYNAFCYGWPTEHYKGDIHLMDPKGVEEISNTYFRSNPVDFPSLV